MGTSAGVGGGVDRGVYGKHDGLGSRGETSKANPGFCVCLTLVDTVAAQDEGAVTFEQGAQGLNVRFTIQR